jgi:hypothetical protein
MSAAAAPPTPLARANRGQKTVDLIRRPGSEPIADEIPATATTTNT